MTEPRSHPDSVINAGAKRSDVPLLVQWLILTEGRSRRARTSPYEGRPSHTTNVFTSFCVGQTNLGIFVYILTWNILACNLCHGLRIYTITTLEEMRNN